MNIQRLLLISCACALSVSVFAYINPKTYRAPSNADREISYRMDCAQATAEVDMDANNVRARLMTGGDVWWNLSRGLYVVPAVEPGSGIPEVSSIFAGAVWLGGFDDGGNLKMACQDYRGANSNDFWPGPLDPISGTVDQQTCRDWDLFFEVQGAEIDLHRARFKAAELAGTLPLDPEQIPDGVKYWPGQGNVFFADEYGFELPNTGQGLGAFFDQDLNGIYEPDLGDFPIIEIRGCDVVAFPDEMIYWIYNDNGGVHTNTQGEPIQMEVQVQTFAFESNDELNNMTFQRYKLINRATEDIDSTFFAMWVDPDLGCYTDDYVGCDVERSLGYIYNEDAVDGDVGCECFGVNTYCEEVPILGVDYFRGPLSDELEPVFDEDSVIIDFVPIELGMSSFTYYNNGGIGTPNPATTDPTVDFEFYNYLSGSWRDGTPFTFGGDSYNPGSTDEVNYAFVDPPNSVNGWSMCQEDLPFGDRRTIQASGPFRLAPGAVNELIIGVVWLPEVQYPCPDITSLLRADDLAQNLFDNCFQIVNGPDAPDVDIVELDRELVLILSNDSIISNNAKEEYAEIDIFSPNDVDDEDKTYVFEGYKVFQLARDEEVSVDDINEIDPSEARLIYEVDLKNNVEFLYNWEPFIDPTGVSSEILWVPSVQNAGANGGIRKTLRVTQDQFADSDRNLINHKEYHFIAIAYGYNEYEPFDPSTGLGQRKPFIVGRRNKEVVSGTPRPIVYENLQSQYGDGPIVTRLDGVGIGDNFVSISKEERESFLDGSFDGEITYEPGQAPIEVSVFNPFEIQDGDYLLEFIDGNLDDDVLEEDAGWVITDENTGRKFRSERDISRINDQVFGELGFSVRIGQTAETGDNVDDSNGAIGATASYGDGLSSQWFAGIPDSDPSPTSVFNFVKTGTNEVDFERDINQGLNNLGGSSWNPYVLADFRENQAAPNPPSMLTPSMIDQTLGNLVRQKSKLEDLNNVDIVFTNDKTKWSRCMIIETMNTYYSSAAYQINRESENGSGHFELRNVPSVGKDDNNGDGLPDPDGETDEDGEPLIGMGWFPGYAVDVETGQRLNIFFGENSGYSAEDTDYFPDGNVYTRDMMFNPSSELFVPPTDGTPPNLDNFIAGGQHWIYVTRQEYDSCNAMRALFEPGSNRLRRINSLSEITWTSLPILSEGSEWLSYQDGLIPNEYTVELRVSNPYGIEEDEDVTLPHPAYRFSFDGVQSQNLAGEEEVNGALDNINVVPNPYFAFSDYETVENTSVVRITNLPPKATVTIYSLDGRFIRQYRRDVAGVPQTNRANPGIGTTQEIPYLEWDIRNSRGIPVAAGVYLIHVEAPELGERVIKWFGVNRKFNPSTLQ